MTAVSEQSRENSPAPPVLSIPSSARPQSRCLLPKPVVAQAHAMLFWLKKLSRFWLMPLPCANSHDRGFVLTAANGGADWDEYCWRPDIVLLIAFSNKAGQPVAHRPAQGASHRFPNSLGFIARTHRTRRLRYNAWYSGGGHGDRARAVGSKQVEHLRALAARPKGRGWPGPLP